MSKFDREFRLSKAGKILGLNEANDFAASALVRYTYLAMIHEKGPESFVNFVIGGFNWVSTPHTLEAEARLIASEYRQKAFWAKSLENDPEFERLILEFSSHEQEPT